MRREDEYTKPHAGCSNPGLWTAADAYSAECEVTELVAAFVRAIQPEYCVETGTCFGQTAEAIGKALQANGHGHLRIGEFRRYKPWLHPGAVVGFHDTHHGNLWGEVERLSSERLLRPMLLPTPRGVCFAEVL